MSVNLNTKALGSVGIENDEMDWSATGSGFDIYNSDDRARLESLYDQTMMTIADHQIVEGTVISLTEKDVVVNIGFKSDGLVSLAEFRHMPDLKAGDKIEVYIETQEDKNGQLQLSHKKARMLKAWDRVNSAFETQEVITGFVKCRTKGGLIVDVFGIEAFLPGSQIDVKPIRDYDIFVGKNMEFKVVKINQEFKNVVVSHKILIEEELEQQKVEIMSKLEKGQIVEGTVKNITSYGVFMDLGGVDGLLHITDVSWGRINHPDEVFKLDDKVKVVILDFDEEKKRIALGLKQLLPQPWEALDPELKPGDKIKGKVVVLADYGAFVEVIPGVEGLIHVSEMSWSQHLRSPQDFLKVSDEIDTVVLSLDRAERKISLGIKQLTPDPWQNIVEKYPVGSRHKAKVRNFTNFGVFVELEEGVDGLIHISDLSWAKKIKHPSEFCKINDEIEVAVLEVDAENRRLSLGHKQLEDNPWEVYETVFTVDSVHEGTVGKVTDKGASVTLQYGIEAFAPYRQLMKENNVVAKPGEVIPFKVIEFSKDNRKIVVSHSRLNEEKSNSLKAAQSNEAEKAADETTKSVKKIKESQEKSTLGDLDALSTLKANLEQNEREKAIEKLAAMAEKKEGEAEVAAAEVAAAEAITAAEPVPATEAVADTEVAVEVVADEVAAEEAKPKKKTKKAEVSTEGASTEGEATEAAAE